MKFLPASVLESIIETSCDQSFIIIGVDCSGGGGCGYPAEYNGGDGGSGIIVIRYRV